MSTMETSKGWRRNKTAEQSPEDSDEDEATKRLEPGTVIADKGEASAADMRLLRWDMSQEESDLLDLITKKQVDAVRESSTQDNEDRRAAILRALTWAAGNASKVKESLARDSAGEGPSAQGV